MAEINENDKLITLGRLNALYDEWMDAEYFDVSLSGTLLSVTDKRGNTVTSNLKGEKGEKGDKGDKGDGLNWDTMTDADKEAVINTTAQKVKEDMVFASKQTCKDIIEELT